MRPETSVSMRLLSFTFRDLFWLILLVASAVPWIIEHRRLVKEIELHSARYPFAAATSEKAGSGSSTEAISRQRLAATLASLTDQELEERLGKSMHASALLRDEHAPYLAEMARRGLASSIRNQLDKFTLPGRDRFSRILVTGHESDFLIALRRAEGQGCPIRVVVSVPPLNSGSSAHHSTLVRAEIQNTDPRRKSVWRPYLSPSHWRFVLTDESGRLVGDSNYLYTDSRLRVNRVHTGAREDSRDTIWTDIDLRTFLAPPRSGKYRLQAFYRAAGIRRESDLSDMFITKSEPILVVVHNPNERGSMPSAADLRTGFAGVVACGMLGFFGLSLRARARRWARFFTIRDALWFVVVLAVLAVAWIDHARQVDKLWEVFPDAEAQWSIELADSSTTE
jgi:hypothetical protein